MAKEEAKQKFIAHFAKRDVESIYQSAKSRSEELKRGQEQGGTPPHIKAPGGNS